MSYSTELLEKFKAMKGYGSDRQAAAALSVAAPFLTQIRDGRRHWSDEKAIYIAEQCGIDPREALAGIALDKAAPEHRDLWADIVKRLRLDGISQAVVAVGVLTGQQIDLIGVILRNFAQSRLFKKIGQAV